MSPNAGDGGGGAVAGSRPMSTAVHMAPEKNFGDLTPYLIYAFNKTHFLYLLYEWLNTMGKGGSKGGGR